MRSFFVCVVALAVLYAPNQSHAQGRPAGVVTETVAMRDMMETVTVFGQVVAVRESEVATRVAGIVKDVPVQVGTVVETGDTLAQMDTARLGIELAGAEAQLAIETAGLSIVQAQTDQAQRAYERAKELSPAIAS